MHIVDSRHNLSKNRDSLLFCQMLRLFFLYEMVKVPALTKLHHEMTFWRRVNDLKQLHDIRMVHTRKDINFSMNCHQLALMGQFWLFVSFESNRIPCWLMDRSVHFSESPFSNGQANIKIIRDCEDWLNSLIFSSTNQLDEGFAHFSFRFGLFYQGFCRSFCNRFWCFFLLLFFRNLNRFFWNFFFLGNFLRFWCFRLKFFQCWFGLI